MEARLMQQRIYEVRGNKVMLDFDIAELYDVLPKKIRELVKRHSSHFPEDFIFELTEQEWLAMQSQFATAPILSARRFYGKIPYAFTEHGIVMLANFLRGNINAQMSIKVVRAFIDIKKIKILSDNLTTQLELLQKVVSEDIDEPDIKLNPIYDAIENMIDLKINDKY